MIKLKVKEVSQARGFSQRKLYRTSGVDIRNIQRIFHDPYSIVTTATLDKLATALGVDARELFEYFPNQQ